MFWLICNSCGDLVHQQDPQASFFLSSSLFGEISRVSVWNLSGQLRFPLFCRVFIHLSLNQVLNYVWVILRISDNGCECWLSELFNLWVLSQFRVLFSDEICVIGCWYLWFVFVSEVLPNKRFLFSWVICLHWSFYLVAILCVVLLIH